MCFRTKIAWGAQIRALNLRSRIFNGQITAKTHQNHAIRQNHTDETTSNPPLGHVEPKFACDFESEAPCSDFEIQTAK